jgi:hypothetical protein
VQQVDDLLGFLYLLTPGLVVVSALVVPTGDDLRDPLNQMGTILDGHNVWIRCNVDALQQLGLEAPQVIGPSADELRLDVVRAPLRRACRTRPP